MQMTHLNAVHIGLYNLDITHKHISIAVGKKYNTYKHFISRLTCVI